MSAIRTFNVEVGLPTLDETRRLGLVPCLVVSRQVFGINGHVSVLATLGIHFIRQHQHLVFSQHGPASGCFTS
jgi:hypothetical protein